jgi:hypothetical protein
MGAAALGFPFPALLARAEPLPAASSMAESLR